MVEIEVFLSFGGTQISFLSIPRSDIERLAVFPFRYIRYVMFTICGARGSLFTTPDGPSVNYDRTEIADDENTYYYQPSEDCAFVDHLGIHERVTSSTLTQGRRDDFRSCVVQRDGHACVVTQRPALACDAVHLIPHCKGDEYIEKVIELRSPGDDSAQPSTSTVGIDDIINGMLLSTDLHRQLRAGQIAFIKTPNYGLRPGDIRKFQRGGSGPDYITLHWIKKSETYDPTMLAVLQTLQGSVSNVAQHMVVAGANVDALFQGQGGSPPSTVILDYVYGVAAFKSWYSGRGRVYEVMNEYREDNYANIQPHPRTALPDDTDNAFEDDNPDDDPDDAPDYVPPDHDSDDSSELDDPTDPDFHPPGPRKRLTLTNGGDESDMAKAMDVLNMVLMRIHGITPEMAAERRQKEIEQEEWAAQEASRSKVMEWRKHQGVY